MASTTRRRIAALPTKRAGRYDVVENFAYFIDTHRDQPHVPTFEDDIHRGMSRPTLVHYVPPKPPTLSPTKGVVGSADLGKLIRTEDGRMIDVDPKHKFVEIEWWEKFVTTYILEHGVAPVSGTGETKGQLATSHLRDARAKTYHLKSLRQIVRAHETAAGTATGTPFKPTHGVIPKPPVHPCLRPKTKRKVAS